MRNGMSGHQRAYEGHNDEWLTPPKIVAALGEFDIDPCSPINRPWPTAKKHYTIVDDGFAQEWEGRVWMNPPYGPKMGLWLQKLSVHGNGIALVFARTETELFHKWGWEKASAMLFLRGRIHFHYVDGSQAVANAGAPSVLIAYGANNADALIESNIPGMFVRLGEDNAKVLCAGRVMSKWVCTPSSKHGQFQQRSPADV